MFFAMCSWEETELNTLISLLNLGKENVESGTTLRDLLGASDLSLICKDNISKVELLLHYIIII